MSSDPPRFPFSRPGRAAKTESYLKLALDSERLAGDGPFSARAGALLSARLQEAPVLLTPSCTHALEMAAILLEVGPGDEVVLPSFTFPSTATAFALRGGTLRFAEIDPGSWCMGPEEADRVITEATKVVVAVHYGGSACDPSGLAALCERRGVVLVEDAAQGLFGSWRQRPLGTFGALGALSFHVTKNVCAGEGGALIINDSTLERRAEVIREKGTDRALFMRGEVDKYTWRDLGSSWLMSELQAALLTAQLEEADLWQRRRQAIWQVYSDALGAQSAKLGIQLQTIPEDCVQPAHLFALLLPRGLDRSALIGRLRAAGVQATSHFEPLHSAPASEDRTDLPITSDVASRLIRLPMHVHLTPDDARTICSVLIDSLESLL